MIVPVHVPELSRLQVLPEGELLAVDNDLPDKADVPDNKKNLSFVLHVLFLFHLSLWCHSDLIS